MDLPCLPGTDPKSHITFEEDGSLIERSVLPGGTRIITQQVPATRSVAIACWLPVGSRDETEGHYGATHYLEHLLFKGTKTRTALQLANAFEEVGGMSNASTSKDYTNYYARVLSSDLPMAVETLLDMVTSSVIDPEQMALERGVILEELAAAEDDPMDVLFEAYSSVAYAGTALARPVGGTPETVKAITRDGIWEHYQRTYRSENLVITAAGDVDHATLCALVTAGLERGGWATSGDLTPKARRSPDAIPAAQAARLVRSKDIEQAQVAVGTRSLPLGDPDRWAMNVMVSILGSGMTSRLFQEIREKRGLAYTTFAFNHAYTEAGAFGMYAGCKPHNTEEIEKVMDQVWAELAENGPTEAELQRILGHTRGTMALGMEDNFARMYRLGRSEISTGNLTPLSEQLEAVAHVDVDDVKNIAARLYEGPRFNVTVQTNRTTSPATN
ncbi:hypothetical protein BSR29_03570 [Boudabousia liubingyangii]|uniref:Insulinase family protein n=1 Tax=Boudabousia liubingyangii TaxID=1921764 RepID=A0A1Q5PNT5_9ACTO|nr:hypothetical protein BSR28_03140 [Boudabousia liubingyangii]OKL49177.1 hypothetical protein BSR29_03570 [Boudabousia liubingyangii]